jgi:hypothetical protein
MITFDPVNKRIILDSANVAVQDIYSRWKEWVRLSDNSKWPQAFTTVGGDDLGGGLYVASYFFLLNGWRLRPMEQEHTLILVGNIAVFGGGVPVVHTLGTFNVSIQYTVPVQAQGIATSGSSGGGASITAIESLLQTMILQANIKKVNDLTVTGTGTENNPWGPV